MSLPLFPRLLPRMIRSLPRPTISRTFTSTYASPNPAQARQSRPILFAVLLGGTVFVGAANWTNQDTEYRQKNSSIWRNLGGFGGEGPNARLRLARYQELRTSCKSLLQKYPSDFLTTVLEYHLRLTESQRTCLGIISINTGVFVAWQIPALRGFMAKRFLHDPLGGRVSTMITSVFSHKSLMHFAFNNIALWSIGSTASDWLDRPTLLNPQPRSTSRYEFLAFYIGAGLFSSVTSHIWSTKVLLPRLLKEMSRGIPSHQGTSTILPSLGASGAIYGCLAVTAFAFPDASVSLIFLPMVPIPILYGFGGMVALDSAGLVLGWRMFDHAAHLGGALAGFFYFEEGHYYFEQLRNWLYGLEEEGKSKN